ncbi:polysaccharide deacetylase family protein [Streptomyces xanthochromogenes]|uniref:polysaccharide deacetylase family protein n=1 Tax=Streptomyces xanthochromogenes TaxID=67384 RepID=UPI003815324E
MARPTAHTRRIAMATAAAVVLTGGVAAAVFLGSDTSADGPGPALAHSSAKSHAPGKSDDKPAGRPSGPARPSGPGGDDSAPDGSDGSADATGAAGPPGSGGISETIDHATESGGKSVSITIDDGPSPVWTPKILAVLKQYGVKATFCMIGPQAKADPAMVKEVVEAGHRLCDHTVSHDEAMNKKPVAYQSAEILDAQKMIEQAAGGAKVQYFRAPGGAFTPDNRHIAAGHGMRPLGWNVDTKDWKQPGTGTIVKTVKQELKNGPIVLFHDGGGSRGQTVEALKELLPWLAKEGYTFSFPAV